MKGAFSNLYDEDDQIFGLPGESQFTPIVPV